MTMRNGRLRSLTRKSEEWLLTSTGLNMQISWTAATFRKRFLIRLSYVSAHTIHSPRILPDRKGPYGQLSAIRQPQADINDCTCRQHVTQRPRRRKVGQVTDIVHSRLQQDMQPQKIGNLRISRRQALRQGRRDGEAREVLQQAVVRGSQAEWHALQSMDMFPG